MLYASGEFDVVGVIHWVAPHQAYTHLHSPPPSLNSPTLACCDVNHEGSKVLGNRTPARAHMQPSVDVHRTTVVMHHASCRLHDCRDAPCIRCPCRHAWSPLVTGQHAQRECELCLLVCLPLNKVKSIRLTSGVWMCRLHVHAQGIGCSPGCKPHHGLTNTDRRTINSSWPNACLLHVR